MRHRSRLRRIAKSFPPLSCPHGWEVRVTGVTSERAEGDPDIKGKVVDEQNASEPGAICPQCQREKNLIIVTYKPCDCGRCPVCKGEV